MTDKEAPIAPPTVAEPAGLGAECRDFLVPPGSRLKNAPDDYTHGSVNVQINYWRERAIAGEARMRLRLDEIDALKLRIAELEAK